MSTTNINIRVDNELKKEAESLFDDLGLTMSSAINMFLKSAVANDGIPFTISRKKLNSTTKAALAEYDEMKKNPSKYKRYDSFAEILKEVEND